MSSHRQTQGCSFTDEQSRSAVHIWSPGASRHLWRLAHRFQYRSSGVERNVSWRSCKFCYPLLFLHSTAYLTFCGWQTSSCCTSSVYLMLSYWFEFVDAGRWLLREQWRTTRGVCDWFGWQFNPSRMSWHWAVPRPRVPEATGSWTSAGTKHMNSLTWWSCTDRCCSIVNDEQIILLRRIHMLWPVECTCTNVCRNFVKIWCPLCFDL